MMIKVNGAVAIASAALKLSVLSGFAFAAGERFVLINGGTTLTAELAHVTVNLPGSPSAVGWALSDEGNNLVFTSLNNGSGDALLDFDASTTFGAAHAIFGDGFGSGGGGRFEAVRFFHASGLKGT